MSLQGNLEGPSGLGAFKKYMEPMPADYKMQRSYSFILLLSLVFAGVVCFVREPQREPFKPACQGRDSTAIGKLICLFNEALAPRAESSLTEFRFHGSADWFLVWMLLVSPSEKHLDGLSNLFNRS